MQGRLEELERGNDNAGRRQCEQIDKLKKDKRRMDELITLKEEQIERLESVLHEASAKIANMQLEKTSFDETFQALEKRHQRDLAKLTNELT